MTNSGLPQPHDDWADRQPVVSGPAEDVEALLDDVAENLGVKRPKKQG